jgi:hypothetical protein
MNIKVCVMGSIDKFSVTVAIPEKMEQVSFAIPSSTIVSIYKYKLVSF